MCSIIALKVHLYSYIHSVYEDPEKILTFLFIWFMVKLINSWTIHVEAQHFKVVSIYSNSEVIFSFGSRGYGSYIWYDKWNIYFY